MRVLHVLSQRPWLTGSGVTLAELCRQAGGSGWEQDVVCGLPDGEPPPALPGVAPDALTAVRFGRPPLDFPLPGMSDVMPYPSSRWQDLDAAQLEAYRHAWRATLADLVSRSRPDVLHVHHLWLVAALAGEVLADVGPGTRLVLHSHATGLRQLELCPHLADEVTAGVRRADAILALHEAQAATIVERLGVQPTRVHVVGAGYDEELFHARGRARPDGPGTAVVYAGKIATAKGIPWLLEAFARVRADRPELTLHLAGGIGSADGEALAARARALPGVVVHGRVEDLAGLMRRGDVFVLPSLYEGLPLVLIEARACGCRLVSTALPGVVSQLAPALGDALQLVPPPRCHDVDVPVEQDLPAFVDGLATALRRALDASTPAPSARELGDFRWSGVFRRVEAVWRG